MRAALDRALAIVVKKRVDSEIAVCRHSAHSGILAKDSDTKNLILGLSAVRLCVSG